jgi:polysaccharide deacetylase family protein (PEP-CTERM system associated)
MRNALSVDVEDWYHDASRPAGEARPEEIAAVGARVERNVEVLLELFAEQRARATFFFLADVARALPGLVCEVARRGHEIACHGLAHRPISSRSPADVRGDIDTARAIVEDVAGVRVLGFRAPYFLHHPDDLWVLDVLGECGLRYDSSYMPIRYSPGPVPRLGGRGGPMRMPSGVWEFPLPLSRVPSGHVLPCAAGGFTLRALPFAITRRYLERFNREVGPAVVYTHPWEIDPDSPKLPGTPSHVRWFNTVGRSRMREKLSRLLGTFEFAPLAEVYAKELALTPSP